MIPRTQQMYQKQRTKKVSIRRICTGRTTFDNFEWKCTASQARKRRPKIRRTREYVYTPSKNNNESQLWQHRIGFVHTFLVFSFCVISPFQRWSLDFYIYVSVYHVNFLYQRLWSTYLHIFYSFIQSSLISYLNFACFCVSFFV